MTKERMQEIARGNIDKHIGDVIEDPEDKETVYEEAYTLGLDALVDAGVSLETARPIAHEIANSYAQP